MSIPPPALKKRADVVTMSHIARLAKVSRPNVSIVLNDRHVGIAEGTCMRVPEKFLHKSKATNCLAA